MSQKRNLLLPLLLIICFLSLASCRQQAAPATTEPSPAQSAAVEDEGTEAGKLSDPVEVGTRYLLTTADFQAAGGYLTATRAGEGLMQIRRPRYETEQTYWSFTPAGEGYYHLRQADQAETVAYDNSLVAVTTAEDETQLWQIVLLNNGYYRLTNKALGEAQSLAALGEGMPYLGWGEVALAGTAEDETQYWVLSAAPEPELAEEPPRRGAVEAADKVISLAAGTWQRGDQPYGELSGGKLAYDFSPATAADDFVLFQQPAGVEGQPNLITAQLAGDGSGHLLNVWLEDAQGEIWSIGLGQVGQGTQTLTQAIDPDSGWPTGHISGPQNGLIDYPIRFSGVVLDRASGPVAGEIALESFTFSSGEAPPAEIEAAVPASETTASTETETETQTITAPQSETAPASNPVPAASNTNSGAGLGYLFDLIPLEDARDSRPAAEHADLNLKLRELQPIQEALDLVEINGDTDEYAPNFVNVLEPKFVAVYTGYDWDWSCNCKGDPIDNPWGQVAAVEIATTPGQPLYIPRRKFDIYQGKYYAVLLYATEESLTFVYAREGIIANGYAVYYQGLKTDPALLKLYRESQGDALPGLTLESPVGTATDKLLVAVRDRGSFMDPRAAKDWWVDRGLPSPPAAPPAPTEAVDTAPAPVQAEAEPAAGAQAVAAGPANPALLNGGFNDYQPYIRDDEIKTWLEDSFAEAYGSDWTLEIIAEGEKRAHLMDSHTFGAFTQKYFNGGGRDYHTEGDHSQVISSRYSFDLLLRQTVQADPGREYTFRGSLVSFYKGTSGEMADGKVFKTLGIDPAGGQDWRSSTVVWGERDGKDNEWRYPAVSAEAQGRAITVFIRLENVEEDVGETELNTIHLDAFSLE